MSGSEAAAPPEESPTAGGGAKRAKPWLRFVLTFAILAIVSEAFYYGMALESAAFRAYLQVLAEISGAILGPFIDDLAIRGSQLRNHAFSIEVSQGCDAVQICTLLAAAVIAAPLGVKQKLRGLVLGILWLQLLNLARITTLFLMGASYSPMFRTAHEVVWPTFLIAMTIATWIFWVWQETRTVPRPVQHAA